MPQLQAVKFLLSFYNLALQKTRVINWFCLLIILLKLPNQVDANPTEQCLQVGKIILQDAEALTLETNQLTAPYEHKCLTSAELNKLLSLITNLYVHAGYITTRAYIPEQELAKDGLIIKIRHGVIEATEFTDPLYKAAANVFPERPNNLLNLRDLEQGIDQLNRLPGNNAQIKIKPGKTPGGSVVVIDNLPQKKWYLSTGLDNSGIKSRGRVQSFSNLNLTNILGLHDLTSLGWRQSLANDDERYLKSYNLLFSVPYQYYSLTVNYDKARYHNFILASTERISNQGDSEIIRVNLDHTIHRNHSGKTLINIAWQRDDYSNYLAENQIEVATYKSGKIEFGLNHQQIIWGSIISGDARYTFGQKNNNANNSLYSNPADKYFARFNSSLSWLRPLPILPTLRPKFMLTMQSQMTDSVLVGTEKFTVGGNNSIRGHRTTSENAERAWLLRNELSVDLPLLAGLAPEFLNLPQFFASYDFGYYGQNEYQGWSYGKKSGAAVGLRNNNGHLKIDMVVARGLERGSKTEIYLSMTVNI